MNKAEFLRTCKINSKDVHGGIIFDLPIWELHDLRTAIGIDGITEETKGGSFIIQYRLEDCYAVLFTRLPDKRGWFSPRVMFDDKPFIEESK